MSAIPSSWLDLRMNPFHLAIPVSDLEASRRFYGDLLGCAEGRSSDHWVDFDLMGHQLTVHRVDVAATRFDRAGKVDGVGVPIPHFGVVLTRPEWDALAARLKEKGATFVLEPQVRYVGKPSEQATFFIDDPSGNALEFKSMTHPDAMLEAE